MSVALFRGLSAFPITPADPDGRVEEAGLEALLDRLRDVHSVGLLGSTGTYAYLGRKERRRAVVIAARALRGRVPLVVGVGALRTDAACRLARDAEEAGADGLLLAPVSYTPLTEEEVFRHFVAVAGATALPLCIYNNPSTTRFSFGEALVARLAAVPRIVAIKNPAPPEAEAALAHRRLATRLPEGFAIGYSVDWQVAPALRAGGVAWYSVLGGILPKPALALFAAATGGDEAEAARLDAALRPLWGLFQEFGSLRVAYAIARLQDLTRADPPLPLLPLGPADRARVETALARLA